MAVFGSTMFATDKVGSLRFWATEQITYPGRYHCAWIAHSLLVVVSSPDWLAEGVTNRESVTFTRGLICRVLSRGLGGCFGSLATVLIHSLHGAGLACLFWGPNVAGYIPSHRHLDFSFLDLRKNIDLSKDLFTDVICVSFNFWLIVCFKWDVLLY